MITVQSFNFSSFLICSVEESVAHFKNATPVVISKVLGAWSCCAVFPLIREKKKKLLYGEVLFKIDSLFWFALVTLLMGFLWLILGKSQESLRNVRFITHTLSYCSALKIFCFATSSFAFAVAAAVAIYKFLLSGRFGIWQEQAKKDSERNFDILKIRKLLIDLHSILFNSVQFIIQRLWMTALEKPLEVRSKRF